MTKIAEKIILAAIKKRPADAEQFNDLKRRVLRLAQTHENFPDTAELLKAYHKLMRENKIRKNHKLERLLVKRAVRTLSGVSIITVLTKPYACPGACVYCPSEKSMPKSYISDEPAAARAFLLHFDPFKQVGARMAALEKNGHPTDKIELIVKGGTWNAYPLAYQYWFILRCFEAANGDRASKQKNITTKINDLRKKILSAQKKNEKAKHRIVGLTLETRPDFINEKNIFTMRELGCTRVELGVQTIDDEILQLIKRGHNAAESARAAKLLKNFGLKVDFHLMPQLPGTTPAKDKKMMTEIFDNPAYRPDMIKIYPCTVVKKSSLYKWVKSGRFKPYSDKKLIDLLINFKTIVPRYVRISRLIRDIPGHHIVAGNTKTNLRQIIQAEMSRRGLRCNCLRCREVGHANVILSQPKLFIDKYLASGGTEYFLSFEDAKRRVVYAFCRLRVSKDGFYPAFIRELHTYGQSLEIGAKQAGASQHKGLGVKLIHKAERIAANSGAEKIAVISGVGVRGYYRKLGYNLEDSYMVKKM